MARIRTIKPEFWTSPGIKGLDPYSRLLFIAMWNWADDYGVGTANAKELSGFAFPSDDEIDSASIRRMLGEIRRVFGVVFYEVDARPYYYIPSWEKHQKVDRRSARRHPMPDAGAPWNPDPSDTTWGARDQQKRSSERQISAGSMNSHESPPSPRWDAGVGTEEQRNRGTTTCPPAAPEDASVDDALFNTPAAAVPAQRTPAHKTKPRPDEDPKWKEFWYEAYPVKAGRADALAAWTKATGAKKIDPDVIIAGARRYRAKCERERTETSKIKHAQGWLNGQRWEDEDASPVATAPASSPSVGALSPDAARCPRHPRQIANSCGPCASEQRARPRQEVGAQ